MLRIIFLVPLALLLLAAPALGADGVPSPNNELLLSHDQFWTAVLGAIVPGFMYVANHFAPWCSDRVKAVATLLVSAAVGALFQLLDAGDLDLDTETLEVVLTTVFFTFASHIGFWRPSGLNDRLGGGTNASRRAA